MKNKSKKVIAPIKIKEEKDGNNELKELSSYVDDRVALMQQVFLTIKPKKLKSMVPDCLKDLEINEIKELCLEEVLGISTKRLKSIIQGTKCPSDTNSDSEVDEIIEHISLDEISSDDSVTFMSDEENKKNKTGNKEMTVLELVELQARARAIRSQLALEPVKKEVEHYSDDENTKCDKKSSKKTAVSENTENDKIANSQPSSSLKSVRRTKNHTSPNHVNDTHKDKFKLSDNNTLSNDNNVLVEHEKGEISSSDSESAIKNHRSLKKKKRLHLKRKSTKDIRTRQIEINESKNLKVNVLFNSQLEKDDDDEINLYVSDTEKQELLSESGKTKRLSHNSESDVSIVDLNNSPLIISSENENDFKDEKEEGEIDSLPMEMKKEVNEENNENENEEKYTGYAEQSNEIKNSKESQDNRDGQSDEFSSDGEVLEEITDWKTRWMNSDKVKKVLVTSKLCSNIKKKQKSKVSKQEELTKNELTKNDSDSIPTANTEIVGSVEEFRSLSNAEKPNQELLEINESKPSKETETESEI